MFGGLGRRGARGTLWEPNADVYLAANSLELVLELPGVRLNDLELSFDEARGVLTLRGVRREGNVSRRVSCQQLELYYGEFYREFALPNIVVDTKQMRAKYEDGMLFVSLPIISHGNPSQTIQVETD
jgi:HSP20 family molecular chaperone IbpA